jgi:hypothetical protein
MSYLNRDDAGYRTGCARFLCTIAALCAIGQANAHAAESWQILLTHQLKEQQRCILGELLFVNEIRVGDRVGLVGRIRCTDAREYDFEREQPNQRFVIRLCQPAVC